jgi:MSHA biogenesis protein MshJ
MSALSSFKTRGIDFFLWINNRSLRERILICCAVQLIVLTIIGFGLLVPRWQLRNVLVHEIDLRITRLSAISAEADSLKTAEKIDPDQSNRELLKKINVQSDELRTDLTKLYDILVKPEDMALRLQTMININGKLQLVSLDTLPVDNLMQGKKIPEINPEKTPVLSESNPAADNPLAMDGIYRHGVVIVVRGSYPDIVDYLVGLESSPSGFYWGNMEMHADNYPQVTMHITLFTLSLDKKWLSL